MKAEQRWGGRSVSAFPRLLMASILACGAFSQTAQAADDDDFSLVIVDDEATANEDGIIVLGDDDDDDDVIIILDEGDLPVADDAGSSGPLGRVWDAWHIAADTDLFASAQLTDASNGPFRMLGSLWVESWLLPAPNLSFYGTAIGRLGWDSTPEGRFVAFADVYELYAKVTLERATVNLGRLVVPWGRTRAAGFGDRLNPPDLRRGGPFPDPVRQKQPQVGVQVKGSLDVVGVEAVAFVAYEPTEGALTAANQGGVRIGRYQSALARSPAHAGGLLTQEDTAALRPPTAIAQPTLAARAWRRVGELDLTASVALHFDETPELKLAPDVATALGAEGLALRGLPQTVQTTPPCEGDTSLSCLGPPGTLTHRQTTSVGLDASWGLGLVVVRAEAVIFPRFGEQGGKTALILDAEGLKSVQTSQVAAAVAVEGQLGPAVDGSLEIFNVSWEGVPRNARLWGVEVLDTKEDDVDVPASRVVNRLAAGANLGGAFLEDRVRWRLRGEAGVLQPDLLLSAEVRYRLPVFDLYIGGRGDLFTGFPGSPGWMRQDASLLGIFLGEGA